jgi:glycosyltransferase involved in cell wall biosynthesis
VKVALDTQVMLGPPTGIKRYTEHLARLLPQVAPHIEFVFTRGRGGRGQPDAFSSATAKVLSRLSDLVWEQTALPHLLKRQGVDLFHSPRNFGLPLRARCGRVVTILDLIPLLMGNQYFSRWHRAYYLARIRAVAHAADGIITISEASRRDIVSHLGTPAEKVRVVYLAADLPAAEVEPQLLDTVLRKHGLRQGFVLTMGGTEPRKNVERVIAAYLALRRAGAMDRQLVIVGNPWPGRSWPNAPDGGRWEEAGIHRLGYVPDEDVACLYRAASCFVFPSLMEGFGIPVLEAMVHGTPVITSTVSSLPEVAGDAAVLVDPRDTEAIARAIVSVVESPNLTAELSVKGKRQAACFSWEKMARETAAIYEEVHRQRQRPRR